MHTFYYERLFILVYVKLQLLLLLQCIENDSNNNNMTKRFHLAQEGCFKVFIDSVYYNKIFIIHCIIKCSGVRIFMHFLSPQRPMFQTRLFC